MVPGTAERDRFTSHEQWIDWWRVASPSGSRVLQHVNAGPRWTWPPVLLRRSQIRRKATGSGRGWFRQGLRREVSTGY